jgi:hypothetical protein
VDYAPRTCPATVGMTTMTHQWGATASPALIGFTTMRNTYPVGSWSHSHGNGSGHPSNEIAIAIDPAAIPVNGIRRHLATCSCGATQVHLPYAKRNRR